MNATIAYKQNQILTSSPEELTLLLYKGAVNFCLQSIDAIENKKIELSHHYNIRVQNIIRELMVTLDMNYEISKNLMAIYDYINRRLIEANIHKDAEILKEVQGLLNELRDVWAEAIKLRKTNSLK